MSVRHSKGLDTQVTFPYIRSPRGRWSGRDELGGTECLSSVTSSAGAEVGVVSGGFGDEDRGSGGSVLWEPFGPPSSPVGPGGGPPLVRPQAPGVRKAQEPR